MGFALGGAIANSAISTVTTTMQAEKARNQQLAQASAMEAQGDLLRKQAQLQAQKGEVEARAIDRQKRVIRRQFEGLQGRNRANLGAGNVDMSSGSAALVSEGNIQRFAEDMAENAYAAALKRWETDTAVKNTQYQAEQYDAQSSYLKDTAGNLLSSLLLGQLAGASAFFGGGGMQAIGSLAQGNQAPQTGQTMYWDRALQTYTASNPIH